MVQEVEAGVSAQVFFQFLLDAGTLHHHYLAYFIDDAPEGGAIRGQNNHLATLVEHAVSEGDVEAVVERGGDGMVIADGVGVGEVVEECVVVGMVMMLGLKLPGSFHAIKLHDEGAIWAFLLIVESCLDGDESRMTFNIVTSGLRVFGCDDGGWVRGDEEGDAHKCILD